MNWVVQFLRWFSTIISLLLSVSALSDNESLVAGPKSSSVETLSLDVYKSQNCGCCNKWISHVKEFSFESELHHPEDLNQIKLNRRIEPRHQSCHTAVSADGYVFEGHVPGHIIQHFLANPPKDSIGLAVPGMPIGSPGMEVGDRFNPYDILLLRADGTSEIYIHMANTQSGMTGTGGGSNGGQP